MHTFVSMKGSVCRICVDVRLSMNCPRKGRPFVIRPESVRGDIGATSQIGLARHSGIIAKLSGMGISRRGLVPPGTLPKKPMGIVAAQSRIRESDSAAASRNS
jgi:hypothetical protein